MTPLPPLHPFIYEPILRRGLEEDLGTAGDLTTDGIVADDGPLTANIVARTAGCVAGVQVAAAAFSLLDPDVAVDTLIEDGSDVDGGEVLATVSGPVRAILTGERLALNVLGHMCGVATATRKLVSAIQPHHTNVVCTRKTTPGLRALEKYAVRAGGGVNHRFGLDDGVLIKDNHLAIAGSVREAVARVRRSVGHMVKIEVEVDSLSQLDEALAAQVDAVLLDNMSVATLGEAVRTVGGRVIVEASGGITLDNAAAIAATGVDLISAGWITHSAPALDVALEVVPG